MAQAQFSRRAGDSEVVVSASGEIDIVTAPALESELSAASEGGGTVVVDLAAVSFVDSSGLNALVRASRALEAGGRALALRNPSEACWRVLEATGLDGVLEIRKS